MGDKKEKKELEELRGLVHTGPSSIWTGMKMASLKRRYPRHFLRFEDEVKDQKDREEEIGEKG